MLYFLSYDMKSLTAEANKHYKAVAGEQLAFAPGEIYKEVKIGIINTDNSFEGNKTFQVIFSSSQRSVTMKGPQQVNVTIMYTKGKRNSFISTWCFENWAAKKCQSVSHRLLI